MDSIRLNSAEGRITDSAGGSLILEQVLPQDDNIQGSEVTILNLPEGADQVLGDHLDGLPVVLSIRMTAGFGS